jgi:hypothetical protein
MLTGCSLDLKFRMVNFLQMEEGVKMIATFSITAFATLVVFAIDIIQKRGATFSHK